MKATGTRHDATTTKKELITVALADMWAVDMHPFHTVKSSGFRNYTQTVLNFGVNLKVGMSMDKTLHVQTAIKQNAHKRSSAGRKLLATILYAHLAEWFWIGWTTDIRTEGTN